MPDKPLVVAERLDLLDLLRELTPQEWEAPSLCDGWRVRDVVAHLLSYEGQPVGSLASRALRGGLLPDRMNALGVRELAGVSTAELLERFEEHLAPAWPATLFGGRLGLTDTLVHQQDIRRALGRPRTIPGQRVRLALEFALTAPPLRGGWRARGTTLLAEDVRWQHGSGPVVRGPGEAVLMAIAGRAQALADLSGPGVPVLARRLPHAHLAAG